MTKEITRDVILVLIVVAGLVSFFYNPTGVDMKFLQVLMGGIVGWYTGVETIPVLGAIKKR